MAERAVTTRREAGSWRSEIVTKVMVLIPLSLLLGCVQDSVKPLSVPLQYRMMAGAEEFETLPECAAVSRVEVVDVRSDPAIGERVNEDEDAAPVPVTTASDVSEWIGTGVEEALRTSGVTLGRPEAPVLRIEVERIRTFENVYRRAGYEGRISLSAEIVMPGDGDSICWLRQSNGSAGNYGYAGSVENYQETLNHALDRALIALFDNPGFQRAVCERCR